MFFILLILILLIILIINSKLQLKIYNLDISTVRKEKIKKNYEIYLGIIIFDKIEILKLNLKKLQTRQINMKTILDKAKMIEEKSNNKKQLAKTALIGFKDLQIKIISADINLELGTENAATTALLIGVISSIFGIILKGKKFKVSPLYQDRNILNIKLNCIIRFNLIHYIYKTILKGRDKNERKSSDRRPYAYSNE